MYLPKKEQINQNTDLSHIPSFGSLQKKYDVFKQDQLEREKGGWSRFFVVCFLIALFLVIVFLVWQSIYFLKIYRNFQAIAGSIKEVRTEYLAKDFSGVKQSLDTAQANIYEAKQNLTKINLLPISILTETTKPLDEFLSVIYDLTIDFREINSLSEKFYQSAENKTAEGLVENIDTLTFFADNLDNILAVNLKLKTDKDNLVNLLNSDNFFMRYIKKRTADIFTELDSFNLSLTQNLPYLEILPNLLGYDQEKSYLLLFQNSSELRPTGGFWGSYGILKINKGKITKFEIDDIYHLDVNIYDKNVAPPPPAPIAKYLNKNWFFRDANWSPAFGEAAQTAQYFYKLEGGEEENFDGVIAITPQLIEDFLLYLGPIEVDGLSFDRENFMSLLQYEVEVGFQGKSISSWDRKNIIEPLAEKLIAKLQNSLSLETISEVTAIFENSLKKKDILFYFNDPVLEEIALGHNWGGGIIGTRGDYLNIIDANLASFKTDLYIDRQIDYTIKKVDKENGDYDLVATLKIKYLHRGHFDWKTTRYRTYTRVYLPLESRLISWQGVMADDRSSIVGGLDVYDEFGKTVLGGFIAVEPQRGGVLEFEYTLPKRIKDKIEQGEYQLIVQKQPGVENKTIKLNLEFAKPIKKVIVSYGQYSVFSNQLIMENTALNKDLEVNIKF